MSGYSKKLRFSVFAVPFLVKLLLQPLCKCSGVIFRYILPVCETVGVEKGLYTFFFFFVVIITAKQSAAQKINLL